MWNSRAKRVAEHCWHWAGTFRTFIIKDFIENIPLPTFKASMTVKSSKQLIRTILGIHLNDLLLHRCRQPAAWSLAVFQNFDSLLTSVLQNAQHPEGIKSAYANDLLAYLLGPLRHHTIDSLPDNLVAVTSRDWIGPANTIVIVSAAVGEQAPLDRYLDTDIPDLLGWLVYRTVPTDGMYLYDPILAAASAGKVEVLLHPIKALYKIYSAYCSE
jgi:hypothetical protein